MHTLLSVTVQTLDPNKDFSVIGNAYLHQILRHITIENEIKIYVTS